MAKEEIPAQGEKVEPSIVPLTVATVAVITITVGRFCFSTHNLSVFGTYEAFAHLIVGGLITAACLKRSWYLATLAAVPSLVELVVFLTGTS